MTRDEQERYIEFLEEVLILSRQKEDYFQKVLENYGSYRADNYLRKIKEVEEMIQGKLEEMERIRYQEKELRSQSI